MHCFFIYNLKKAAAYRSHLQISIYFPVFIFMFYYRPFLPAYQMRRFKMMLVSAFLSFAALAQDNFRFIPYGEDYGLPQSSIYDIAQDQNGFIWIGTAGGVCRFDGYGMKVYKQSA